VERTGEVIARIVPVVPPKPVSLSDVLAAWQAAGDDDLAFADDLDRVAAEDRAPENPWAS